MKTYLSKPALRWVAGLIVVVSTCWNFWDLSAALVGDRRPREFDDIVVFENRFLQIKFELWRQGYRSGDLAYATVRSFRGQPVTDRDATHWAQLRYVTIPFNLVRDLPNATYVLGDFTRGDPVPETPEGLIKLFDSGDGLILYKRDPSHK